MSTLTAGAGAAAEFADPAGALPLAPAGGVEELAGAPLAAGADGPEAVDPGGAPAAHEDPASGTISAKTMNIGRRMRDFPFPKAGCASECIGLDAGFVVRAPSRAKRGESMFAGAHLATAPFEGFASSCPQPAIPRLCCTLSPLSLSLRLALL